MENKTKSILSVIFAFIGLIVGHTYFPVFTLPLFGALSIYFGYSARKEEITKLSNFGVIFGGLLLVIFLSNILFMSILFLSFTFKLPSIFTAIHYLLLRLLILIPVLILGIIYFENNLLDSIFQDFNFKRLILKSILFLIVFYTITISGTLFYQYINNTLLAQTSAFLTILLFGLFAIIAIFWRKIKKLSIANKLGFWLGIILPLIIFLFIVYSPFNSIFDLIPLTFIDLIKIIFTSGIGFIIFKIIIFFESR
ncbi:MAG: hypothetical protein MAG795_00896 [Candidatus Woesearchaeota archaeon]|nr:hypothetical protein [Candidatus Woesearchaeota archaeon]